MKQDPGYVLPLVVEEHTERSINCSFTGPCNVNERIDYKIYDSGSRKRCMAKFFIKEIAEEFAAWYNSTH